MKSVCKVYRNYAPARFTGNFLRWICETPDGKVFCDTRESARETAREYNAERRRLLQEGMREQARQEFYN